MTAARDRDARTDRVTAVPLADMTWMVAAPAASARAKAISSFTD